MATRMSITLHPEDIEMLDELRVHFMDRFHGPRTPKLSRAETARTSIALAHKTMQAHQRRAKREERGETDA